ncbi:carboxypeptidase regulatory-like domain-containing protein [Agrococcus sp. SL85]|uniref:prepilin-type N-terminal cleavage/methylation domain-containing protein n=1 Tax=Agrococcus sp. SL85 TaxID=2995141 RepID=UPI00226D1DE1|nr:prepilin-type N-terminal cleavage/methylation domain-containing protein [Agrococcus sp. SL85]WAC66371.1 carboxypeptidase regulatory-like domain-containing protein [Agrococcus sp. SL85]
MRSIRARFPVAAGDRGMTLVEVMVAMFVFAIIATAVLASLVQVLATNRESRAQHVAASLAASEIELAHDTADLFTLLDATRTVTVGGVPYTIARTTAWVSASGAAAACGAGGGSLRYKRVHVTVTWPNMPESALPVRADTVVNPAEHINDPAKGTVLVSIIDSVGVGVPSATVSLTATSGGATIAPVSTDSQGCAYFLQVPPGIYDVSVAKLGHTGILEATPRQRDVSVQASSSTSVSLQYDLATTLRLTFAPGTSAPRLPTGMPLSLVTTYGVRSSTLPSTTRTQDVTAHPRVNYRVLAGSVLQANGQECAAVDPTAWPAGLVGLEQLAEGAATDVAGDPGRVATADVRMGLITIPTSVTNLRATSVPGRLGDPTCSGHPVLSYGSVTAGTVIAVPYGTWTLSGTGLGVLLATPASRGQVLLPGTITLDPREVAP